MAQTLRKQVRRRARLRCEYCLIPEAFDPLPFQLDHVIAQQHRGPTVFANLAWACYACNHRKGPNVSGVKAIAAVLRELMEKPPDPPQRRIGFQAPTPRD